ncbi:lysophospholipid acyltransferase family protein [bacterium]|nr:lysophospholipid acyltransferase family protein [bacterium]
MSLSVTARRKPRLRHRFEYALLLAGAAVVVCLPRRAHSFVSRVAAFGWYYLFPFRRSVALENLARAFPEQTSDWRAATIRACARHFIRVALEFPLLRKPDAAVLKDMVADFEGRDNFEAMGSTREPAICVAGHLGNWELEVAWFSLVEQSRISAVAKPLHNPLVERMVYYSRRARGLEIVHTRNTLRQGLRALHEGKVLAFLADQDARRRGVFVPFFGHLASTYREPASFACRLNIPLALFTCVRRADGFYRIRVYPPLYPDPLADRREEVCRLTRLHVEQLEEAIREHPEQYFWFHRRWKTQPKIEKRRKRDKKAAPRTDVP